MRNYIHWKQAVIDTEMGLYNLIRVLRETDANFKTNPSLYSDIVKINKLAKQLDELYDSPQ